MRYSAELGRILISVGEFVSIARRCISASLPFDEDEPRLKNVSPRLKNEILSGADAVELSYDFKKDGIGFTLSGRADITAGTEITVISEGDKRDGSLSRELLSKLRAEAFILAHMYLNSTSDSDISLTIVSVKRESDSYTKKTERVSRATLERFFERCLEKVSIYSPPEIDRVTKRLPSMKGLKFPFKDIRNGQGELVRAVYRSIARGNTLFACAPTGTGKTVSVIYPAVKALGDERCEKVFYLTPKTTTAAAARSCIELLAKKGALIKAVMLTAKEKICPARLICKDTPEGCRYSEDNKLPDAVMALYRLDKTVVEKRDILKISEEFSVCPYELSLSYSELCDIVICDINYLFDPVVYIKRFFSDGGNYAFFIDEAHNLVDRAREMYSTELSFADFDRLIDMRDVFGEHSSFIKDIEALREEFSSVVYPFLKEEIRTDKNGDTLGAAHLSDIPSNMYTFIYNTYSKAEDELYKSRRAKDEEKLTRVALIKEFYYKIKKFSDISELFDEGYKLFLFYENGQMRAKLFCVHTGSVIARCLKKGRGAVFFSATLEPLDYYKSVLGGDSMSDTLTVRSPFDPSQLSVTIMDKISTRYSERERTMPAVCRVIAATMSAKRGHYMVFCPSFEYSEALADYFMAKYPKIHALVQRKGMTQEEKSEFLNAFSSPDGAYLVGFCVMGGIYSEGIDLAGDSLIGALIVGIGMPSMSYEREAIAEYYEEKLEAGKQYAYIYPGMNKVFQAAGRVIRREDDKGVIVLIDDRFDDPIYKKSIPALWRGMRYCNDAKGLRAIIDDFWLDNQDEKK